MNDLERMTVDELVRRYPETLAILQKHRIDLCCGGRLPVEEAARKHRVNLEALLSELRRVIGVLK